MALDTIGFSNRGGGGGINLFLLLLQLIFFALSFPQAFKLSEFDNLDIDMILMSPPCQPYVRVGLQRDLEDKRAASFLHLLKVLPL